MPTYQPLHVKVQLVSCDLAAATTANLQRTKHESNEVAGKAEQALMSAQPLTETHIPCLQDNTRLHFLGNVPFYLVQAGGDVFTPRRPTLAERVQALIDKRQSAQATATEDENGEGPPAQTGGAMAMSDKAHTEPESAESLPIAPSGTKPTTPQALALKITFSYDLFDARFYRSHAHAKGYQRHCIKYDVYFNGELAASNFQHSRYATKKVFQECTLEGGNDHIVAGKRTDILLERPWVIVPPGLRADGGFREVNDVEAGNAGNAGAEERWMAIGRELLARADERGYNEREERSPSGKYLADLAGMEMPSAMADIHKLDNPLFGVIDVIITNGLGNKSGSMKHWLAGPEPLHDPSYKQMPVGWVPSAHKKAVPQSAESFSADASSSNLKGMTSTAAFSRGRRSNTVPASYRDAASRKPRGSNSESSSSSATMSQRIPILPPFPATPQIDFNDAIAITPTQAEEARLNRGEQDGSPSATASSRAISVRKMLPPLIIPRSVHAKRRRSSDTIDISSCSASPIEQVVRSTRPGAVSGSKSVSGYMGMTKRGVFSRGVREMRSPSAPTAPAAKVDNGPTTTEPLITRVLISSGGSPIVDKQLTSPHKLGRSIDNTAPQHAASLHQPLHESAVFTPRPLKHIAKRVSVDTLAPKPMPTPAANSQPHTIASSPPPILNLPPIAPAPEPASTLTKAQDPDEVNTPTKLKNTPKPQASGDRPSPPRKLTVHEQILADERAKWQTPELSKDCVIAYAEEGEWSDKAQGEGSVLRQVKGAWSGDFSENEVVFAVRFIVAVE